MGEAQGQPVVLRILIVEDTPERQGWLTGLYREHAWVLVHTAGRHHEKRWQTDESSAEDGPSGDNAEPTPPVDHPED